VARMASFAQACEDASQSARYTYLALWLASCTRNCHTARPVIVAWLDGAGKTRLPRDSRLHGLGARYWGEWGLSAGPSPPIFLKFLIQETHLRRVVMRSRSYGNIVLYVWRQASPYELAASLKRGTYFSHESALYFHGLCDRAPRTIYVQSRAECQTNV